VLIARFLAGVDLLRHELGRSQEPLDPEQVRALTLGTARALEVIAWVGPSHATSELEEAEALLRRIAATLE
jgi:hypothetical protein